MGAPKPVRYIGAMQIDSASRIHHPRDLVYRVYRDRLEELVPYLDDIKAIQVLSSTPTDTGVKLHNEWHASTEIPSVAQRFLSPDKLRWDDHADWNDTGYYVDWTIKTRAFTEAVSCSGRNTFLEDGEGATKVVLTGSLTLDLKKVKGVPSFLAGSIGPRIEAFIVELITPNLVAVNQSLERFLDSEAGS